MLRVEALYWALVLAAWPLWRSVYARVVLAVFAAIHIGVWFAAEWRPARLANAPESPSSRRALARVVTAFDSIEVLPLVAVAVYCLSYLLRAK